MKYIDLGLPSGTLWAESNEDGFYTFNEAVEKYGDSLPTPEQLEELKDLCKWEWNGGGYKVTGPNGNAIVLPAAGLRSCDGYVNYIDFLGYYWSSTPMGLSYAWRLGFDSSSVYVYNGLQSNGASVRLVKSKKNKDNDIKS